MLKETGIQIAITFNQIFPIIGVRHESFKIFFYNTSIKTLAAELYLSSHKKLGHWCPPSSYLFMTRVYSSTTIMYIKDLIFFSLINFHRHHHFNTQSEIWLFWSVNWTPSIQWLQYCKMCMNLNLYNYKLINLHFVSEAGNSTSCFLTLSNNSSAPPLTQKIKTSSLKTWNIFLHTDTCILIYRYTFIHSCVLSYLLLTYWLRYCNWLSTNKHNCSAFALTTTETCYCFI